MWEYIVVCYLYSGSIRKYVGLLNVSRTVKFYVIPAPSYPFTNILDALGLLSVYRRMAIIPQWEYHPAYPLTAHKLAHVGKSPALSRVRATV